MCACSCSILPPAERAVNIFAIFATFGRSAPSSNVPICALIDESASMEFATLLVWKIDLGGWGRWIIMWLSVTKFAACVCVFPEPIRVTTYQISFPDQRLWFRSRKGKAREDLYSSSFRRNGTDQVALRRMLAQPTVRCTMSVAGGLLGVWISK